MPGKLEKSVAIKPLSLIKNAVRAKEIVAILVRYGFDDLLEQLGTPPGWLKRLVPRKWEGMNSWQRIRHTCEELGPTYVKIAQLLSTRPDVLPQPLIEEFKKLRDDVTPIPFENIKPVLVEELDVLIEEAFTEFQRDPIACGSLGQVYKARLSENDQWVTVKIQKPGIKKEIEADLEIIGWFARQFNDRFSELKPFNFPDVVEQTKRGLLRELDYTNEARNATLFNTLNTYPEKVFAPEVVHSLTTRRILVTDWIEGQKIDACTFSEEEGRTLARIGGDSIFHQIVITGFFHADPHEGNLLVTKENRICILDWGLTGQMTRRMRYFLADLLGAIASQDAEKVVRVAARMSRDNRRINTHELEKQVTGILHKYPELTLAKNVVGNILVELLYVFGSNGIHLARDYTLLARAVIAMEETGKSLDPGFNIPSIALPFLKDLSWDRWNPVNVLKQGYIFLLDSFLKLNELPGDVQRILRRIEEEDLSIKLYHRGLDEISELLDHGVNRLTMAIIIGALIIGSSTVITTGVKPHIWGFPAIGIIGYMLSALLGIWIVFDILRHGRHK